MDASSRKKILTLRKILLEETDENHPLTLPQIQEKLKSYGIEAERKSLYRDIGELAEFGLDIIGEKRENRYVYFIGSREFELAEVKLLADAVASARFISGRKSAQLLKKLGTLTSREDAKKLNREVMSAGRVKADNEAVYYNVDNIHTAVNQNRKIRFRYFQWNVKKEQELRHEGAYYTVSPWALIWDDEYYYLVAFDNGKLKHFRVDKMLSLELLPEQREGAEFFEKLDLASYTRKNFSMFSGDEQRVSLEAENRFAGILIDRFGKDIFLYPVDPQHFRASVDVAVSEQFFSWIFSLGEGIRIIGPEKVLEQVRAMTARLSRQYGTEDRTGN